MARTLRNKYRRLFGESLPAIIRIIRVLRETIRRFQLIIPIWQAILGPINRIYRAGTQRLRTTRATFPAIVEPYQATFPAIVEPHRATFPAIVRACRASIQTSRKILPAIIRPTPTNSRALAFGWPLAIICLLTACKKTQTGGSTPSQRSYRMGFQSSAPRWDDFNLFIQSLNIWTQRADAAIISVEVPWDSLLNGQSTEAYVLNNYKGVVDFYRTQHFKLWVYIDPANGLDRAADAVSLAAHGKSIAQPAMQQVYRRFAFVMDSILRPDHLGLALETNVIRDASPDSIYQGIRQAAGAAAADVRAYDKTVPLSISIQVDYAWGNGSGVYRGVTQDFTDFPFIGELGLSSYPYFVFANPQAIPLNYYSKITEGHPLPVFVSEGGWTSEPIPGFSGQPINSDPQTQQNYIARQSLLLDNAGATGVFQLAFTDIDLSSLPPTVPSTIQYFAYLGLVDANLQPRPALATWDSVFKRTLKSGH